MHPLLIVAVTITIVALIAIVVALFQWLWNITMPDVFGLKHITYWQAFRLILLASILMGGRNWDSNRWHRDEVEGTPAVQVASPAPAGVSGAHEGL
jgi:hypothetical protein